MECQLFGGLVKPDFDIHRGFLMKIMVQGARASCIGDVVYCQLILLTTSIIQRGESRGPELSSGG